METKAEANEKTKEAFTTKTVLFIIRIIFVQISVNIVTTYKGSRIKLILC